MRTIREEIAIERFHEILSGKCTPPLEEAAKIAVAQADALIGALYQPDTNRAVLPLASGPKAALGLGLTGCRTCYGSGGKKGNPCKICGGTGKVAVTVTA